MRYKLVKNRNNSTRYDNRLMQLEGTYDSFDLAIEAIGDMDISADRDTIWVYAPGTSDKAMLDDVAGYDMLAAIVEVSEYED